MMFLSGDEEPEAKTGKVSCLVSCRARSWLSVVKPPLLRTRVRSCLPGLGNAAPLWATPWSVQKLLQGKWNRADTLPAPQGASRPEPSALLVCTALRLCSNSKPDCCIFTSWTPKPFGSAETFWHLNVRENALSFSMVLWKTVSTPGDHFPAPESRWEGVKELNLLPISLKWKGLAESPPLRNFRDTVNSSPGTGFERLQTLKEQY